MKVNKHFAVMISLMFLFVGTNLGCNSSNRDSKPAKGEVSSSEKTILPLSNGTFWQLGIGRLDDWSDEKLAAEVAVVKNAGMDIIMLQYGAVWDDKNERYHTYIPDAGFAHFPNLGKRDPLGAIFKAAEKLNIKIIIGDFLVPMNLRYEEPKVAFDHWMSPQAMEFRQNVINRFKDSPSFYAYYMANEPNPHRIKTEADKETWFTTTKQLSEYVKKIHRDIKVIHSIGLYYEWKTGADGVAKSQYVSPAYLESFWGRWIKEMKEVDIWMVIDGIGTKLADERTTDAAQAWAKKFVHNEGKEIWVDVENAVMTATQYYPLTIEEVKSSLEIAAKHADKIVFFEHLSYMTPNSTKQTAKKLHDDYTLYRKNLLGRVNK